MKPIRYILGLGVLALGLCFVTTVRADDAHKKKGHGAATASAAKGKLVKIADSDKAWAAKARGAYPLKVCLTTDEKLGAMGDNAEFIYREAGKPDRLVIFCCDGCEEDFNKEPAKYLAKLDAAAKQKPAGKS